MSTPLGDFLRARRDATRPETLGLPAGPRRRVPGLRRSELASLAGISVEYLVRIEQGSDRNPSASVVNALADALRLDVSEREHLRYLAKIAAGVCIGPLTQPRLEVRQTVLKLLDQLEPGIALVTNRLGDILAYTSGFDLVARPSGLLDTDRPNLTRFVFTDRRAREVFPEWDQIADERAFDLWHGPSAERSAQFRAELAPVAGDDFTQRLNRHALPRRGPLRWTHPVVGELRLDREVLELPPADAQQLVVFLPADDTTADTLNRLRRRGGTSLRAVN
ncbi:transcriptional regulator [Frankia sp. CcI156]|uniref:Transcriptional regulator, XRE family n=1 Tax=Frankia casuarinae (strain DSM 45818 / CECT 9043 / HFP020203 / CcI3) TaxID=106370 RepID=Q2JGJ5_FRACC|nr:MULTISPECIES: helix-turn-helix transcriptional regulator [Frankia]ABD09597.1 transcriptional regulator, XRE family [Frankia casuarinae]OFB43644.1 transcriptional regulator [Frankia sp. CgIM4]OHV57027.1 transcriptional regulator [Frankia sp. CgIS1]ONH27470.1 transcriptional regulator [Frankia sp. CcI156]ORT97406.1 transcriptional regulator [Frankia casuarinae]